MDYSEKVCRATHVTVLGRRVQERVTGGQPQRALATESGFLALVDYEILMWRVDALPNLNRASFYWHQLEGLQVVTVEGQLPGGVSTTCLENRLNDVMVSQSPR